jgi:hypothetical protein
VAVLGAGHVLALVRNKIVIKSRDALHFLKVFTITAKLCSTTLFRTGRVDNNEIGVLVKAFALSAFTRAVVRTATNAKLSKQC